MTAKRKAQKEMHTSLEKTVCPVTYQQSAVLVLLSA